MNETTLSGLLQEAKKSMTEYKALAAAIVLSEIKTNLSGHIYATKNDVRTYLLAW